MSVAFITGAVALLICLAATPVVRRLALALGMTDAPGGRRIHKRPIPRGGGVAVAVGAVVACAVCSGMPAGLNMFTLAGALFLLALGLADDILSMRPEVKLLGQLGAAIVAVAGGIRLSLFDPSGVVGTFGLLDPVVTVAWIVLITNAVNLSDGLDGLAAGVGVIACVWLACTAFVGSDPSAAVAPLALAGALIGFLVYNFNPASIFLGDAGSLVIGYAMAVLPLTQTSGAAMPLPAAALLVAFPVTDTVLAIARRFVSRCVSLWGDGLFWRGLIDGLRNTVSADRCHIHHRLLDLGLSQRRIVLLIYLASATTGALSYVIVRSPGWPVDLFAVGLGIGVITIVQALGIGELQWVRSGLFLPLLRRLAPQRWLLVAGDACTVVAIYGGVLLLTSGPVALGARAFPVAAALLIMASLQLAIFHGLGVYRAAWRATGVGGLGLLIRACATGTVSGYVALRLLDLPTGGAVTVVYFLLLLSAVTLVRFSYAVLMHGAFGTALDEPTLVCGSGEGARYALSRLRGKGPLNLQPIGFIEFKPCWQGRDVDRLPVLGTLDALQAILREQEVRHLVIADPALRGEALAWVRAVCRHADIKVHRYIERFVSHDELVEQLRGAENVADAWTVLGRVFREIGLDRCVLSVDGGANGAAAPRREIYTWRRVIDGPSNGSGSFDACLRQTQGEAATPEPHLNGHGPVNGNGRANGHGPVNGHGDVNGHRPVNGHGAVNGHGPSILRSNGDCRQSLTSTAPSAEDVLALPIWCGEAVWGILLVTPQAGDRLITPAERARLRRAAEVLGQRLAQLNLNRDGRAPILGSSPLSVVGENRRTDRWN